MELTSNIDITRTVCGDSFTSISHHHLKTANAVCPLIYAAGVVLGNEDGSYKSVFTAQIGSASTRVKINI